MGRHKFALLTLAVAAPAVLLAPQTPLGEQVWPAPTHDAAPTSSQLPLFMVLGILDALAFGGAVVFGILGWKHTRSVTGGGPFGALLHLSIVWVFGNFWLHDNLHYINGINLGGLLIIDYLFHVPLTAAGVFIAYGMVRLARERAVETGLHAAQGGRPVGRAQGSR